MANTFSFGAILWVHGILYLFSRKLILVYPILTHNYPFFNLAAGRRGGSFVGEGAFVCLSVSNKSSFSMCWGEEIGHSGGDEDSFRYFNHQSRHIWGFFEWFQRMNTNNAGTGAQTTRLPPQIRDMSEKKKMTDRSVALLAKYHEDARVNMRTTTTQFRGWLGSF